MTAPRPPHPTRCEVCGTVATEIICHTCKTSKDAPGRDVHQLAHPSRPLIDMLDLDDANRECERLANALYELRETMRDIYVVTRSENPRRSFAEIQRLCEDAMERDAEAYA